MITEQETTETTLPVLATRVDEITPAMSKDEVCAIILARDFIKERLAAINEALEGKLIEFIEASPERKIVIGPRRYYVSDTEKKEKDRNIRATLEAVFEKVAGDMDALATCLSSNGFKPGATKKILGDAFEKFFEVTYTKKLKFDGSPDKSVKMIDDRFIK